MPLTKSDIADYERQRDAEFANILMQICTISNLILLIKHLWNLRYDQVYQDLKSKKDETTWPPEIIVGYLFY